MRTQENVSTDPELFGLSPSTGAIAIEHSFSKPIFRQSVGIIAIHPHSGRQSHAKYIFGKNPYATKDNIWLEADEEDVGFPGATAATLAEWPRLWQHPEGTFALNIVTTLLASASHNRFTKIDCLETIYAVVSDSKIYAKDRFQQLATFWKEETKLMSDITEMITHPAYLQIIGMGVFALPLIFEELSRELDHWFPALQAIAGTDPVPGKFCGDVTQMRLYWLNWGRRNGYIG